MHESTASGPTATSEPIDFEHFEQEILDESCRYGRALALERLAALDDTLALGAEDDLHIKDRRSRCILTRFGEIEISRRRYVDGDGATRYLLDERLALAPRRRLSPPVERSLLRLASSVSFREAADILSTLTAAQVSHASAHSVIARAGDRLAQDASAAAQDLHDLGLDPGGTRQADPLFCEADGTVIALQNARVSRAEVKLAVFYGAKRDSSPVIHAAFTPAKAFWREASARAGATFDLSAVSSTVLSGDGARWVRGGQDAMPHSRFILDPFHVNRALLRALGSYPPARKVFRAIYERGLDVALEMLDHYRDRQPARSGEILRVRAYLTSNAEGLWLHDPSLGSIENHIDKVIANRFKKRGRRWSPAGADRVARVIAASRSGEALPVGVWVAPDERQVRRPLTPRELTRFKPIASGPRHGDIAGRQVGTHLGKTLRGISGTRGSH